jgi:hypothetical protein
MEWGTMLVELINALLGAVLHTALLIPIGVVGVVRWVIAG